MKNPIDLKMSLRMRRFTLIQLLMTVVLVAFTNCGGFQKDQATTAPTTQFNGGGHSGKVTYLAMEIEGDPCLAPTRGLEFGNGQTQAFTYGCNGASQDPFDISRLVRFAFDPNFLIFDENIYAQESLLVLQSNERAQFQIYCASENDQVSFALKMSRFQTATGAMTRATSYVLENSSFTDQVVRTHDPDPQGVRFFTPESGDYTVTVGANTTPTRAPGEILFKQNGRRVNLQCFTIKRTPDPGPNATARSAH